MNPSLATPTCPKDGAELRPYEGNGVVINQCDGRRGIFLDRGELESSMDVESSFYVGRNPAPGYPQPQYPDQGDSRRGGHDGRDSGHGERTDRRKRGGFLSNLLG
ncbi:MAG: TFIIB-type zinc ribbon-containing protein [Actinomycetales bacterium]|uniref:TFIIB-type zinc ribbon-containing protein n=1 Tax=uncultured Salinibacterium sp. TaxID=459274 RepID=UPI0030DBB5B0